MYCTKHKKGWGAFSLDDDDVHTAERKKNTRQKDDVQVVLLTEIVFDKCPKKKVLFTQTYEC